MQAPRMWKLRKGNYLWRVPEFMTSFWPRRPDAACRGKARIEVQACVGRRLRSGWLRECPPACGLLLDLAKPQVHATPRTAQPSISSVGGLRRLHTNVAWRIRLSGCSASRQSPEFLGSEPVVSGQRSSIFGEAAQRWFAGHSTDKEAVQVMAERYARLIKLWDDARHVGARHAGVEFVIPAQTA